MNLLSTDQLPPLSTPWGGKTDVGKLMALYTMIRPQGDCVALLDPNLKVSEKGYLGPASVEVHSWTNQLCPREAGIPL